MQNHIVSAFDDELKSLSADIVEMGGRAEKQVADATVALMARDPEKARRVIAADKTLDQLQHKIEEHAIITIAKRQPMAVDLRQVVAGLRVANDLERIGDLAKNVAKRVIAIEGQFQPPKLFGGLDHMSELAQAQIKDVLDAYTQRDLEAALGVWKRDGDIDALHTSLFRELLTYMMEDPRNIGFCTHLLFCAKNIERIGDHATNIAETVYYMVTGQVLADDRPKQDDSSTTPANFAS